MRPNGAGAEELAGHPATRDFVADAFSQAWIREPLQVLIAISADRSNRVRTSALNFTFNFFDCGKLFSLLLHIGPLSHADYGGH